MKPWALGYAGVVIACIGVHGICGLPGVVLVLGATLVLGVMFDDVVRRLGK